MRRARWLLASSALVRLCIIVRSSRVEPFLQLLPTVRHDASVEREDGGCTPTQVHLALGRDASEMHVTWKTSQDNCPSQLAYRPAESGKTAAAALLKGPGIKNSIGYSFLMSERDMCSEPAASNEFMLYLHRAKLTELVPSTQYYYQISGGSTVHQFMSTPAPSPDHTFTFLAFGDMGDPVHPEAKSPGAASTLLRLQEEVDSPHNPANLVLHVGDISYANGNPSIWDSFMDSIQPVASSVPYMVAIGNHEYGYSKGSGAVIDPSGAPGPYQPSWGNFGPDSKGECGVMTARRFHMPQQQKHAQLRDNAPFWYGFDYGSAHFTVISTEHDLSRGSTQYRWLEAELAAVDRCLTPWLVVLLHRPMYVVYPHKSNREVGEHIRDTIEHLMEKHKVDLTVAGHVHSYYRTCAVYDEQCISERSYADNRRHHDCDSGDCEHGTVNFVIGSAGHKLSEVERGQEVWVLSDVREWGYSRFTVQGSEKLVAEFVSSETGEVLDDVVVIATAARRDLC